MADTFTSAHVDFENGVAYAVTVNGDTGEVQSVDAVNVPEPRDPATEHNGRGTY